MKRFNPAPNPNDLMSLVFDQGDLKASVIQSAFFSQVVQEAKETLEANPDVVKEGEVDKNEDNVLDAANDEAAQEPSHDQPAPEKEALAPLPTDEQHTPSPESVSFEAKVQSARDGWDSNYARVDYGHNAQVSDEPRDLDIAPPPQNVEPLYVPPPLIEAAVQVAGEPDFEYSCDPDVQDEEGFTQCECYAAGGYWLINEDGVICAFDIAQYLVDPEVNGLDLSVVASDENREGDEGIYLTLEDVGMAGNDLTLMGESDPIYEDVKGNLDAVLSEGSNLNIVNVSEVYEVALPQPTMSEVMPQGNIEVVE